MLWGRSIVAGAAILALVGLGSRILSTPSNPGVNPAATLEARMEVPLVVQAALRRACYDCHSHQTVWPWYSRVPPMSWLIKDDVRKARARLNFSDWVVEGRQARQSAVLLLAGCAALKEGAMPPRRYRMLHPASSVSPREVEAFCGWAGRAAAELQQRARMPAPPLPTN